MQIERSSPKHANSTDIRHDLENPVGARTRRKSSMSMAMQIFKEQLKGVYGIRQKATRR